MMDTSLQTVSQQLDGVIQRLIVETKNDFEETGRAIEALNTRLQNMEKTDLSENADYQIAKDERDMKSALHNLLAKRIEAMSHELGNYTPTGFITLGTTVELEVIAVDGKAPMIPKTKYIVKLVQHDTSNALLDLVAIDSKVGAAILGRTAGDTVFVEAPGGIINYYIERIY